MAQTLTISWNPPIQNDGSQLIITGNSYTLSYRKVGNSMYTKITGVTSPYVLTGLTSETNYDICVQSNCTPSCISEVLCTTGTTNPESTPTPTPTPTPTSTSTPTPTPTPTSTPTPTPTPTPVVTSYEYQLGPSYTQANTNLACANIGMDILTPVYAASSVASNVVQFFNDTNLTSGYAGEAEYHAFYRTGGVATYTGQISPSGFVTNRTVCP